MSQGHLHLLVTHLPIIGSALGGAVLAYGIWKKTTQTINAAYLLLIVSAIGAGISYLTGEAAEEMVEGIPGVSETAIHAHEDFAIVALTGLIILGVVSLVSLFLSSRKPSQINKIAILVLLISLVSFGLSVRLGYLGGQIRHTETNVVSVQDKPEGNDDD